VLDEYGTLQVIVTRTNLLEAVAGRLPDIDTGPDQKVTRREDGTLVIDAATAIDDAAELLGLDGNWQKDVVTVAGMVLSKLDHVPLRCLQHNGDVLRLENVPDAAGDLGHH